MAVYDLCSGSSSASEWTTLKLKQSTASTLYAELRSACGEVLDISDLTHEVLFTAKEWATGSDIYIEKECVVQSNGIVQISIRESDVPYAGIWVGEFTVTEIGELASDDVFEEHAEGIVTDRINCYVEVAQSIRASTPGTNRPLSIFEIRMAIRDRSASDNTFLEDLEFSDTEILYALQRPVDYWNEALPPIDQTYTYSTFPYKHHWTNAAVGELFKMASIQLTRNNMDMSAGGINLSDKGKAREYMQIGNGLINEYKAWVMQTKYSLNMQSWFGSVKTPEFG